MNGFFNSLHNNMEINLNYYEILKFIIFKSFFQTKSSSLYQLIIDKWLLVLEVDSRHLKIFTDFNLPRFYNLRRSLECLSSKLYRALPCAME